MSDGPALPPQRREPARSGACVLARSPGRSELAGLGSVTYVPLQRGETRPAAELAFLMNAGEHEGWYRHVCGLEEPVKELGLFFVEDCEIAGDSFAVKNETLILDDSPHSIVTQRFFEEASDGRSHGEAGGAISLDRALVVAAPGHLIWGHWIVDFLPRIALAQGFLGRGLDGYRIPLPSDTPSWVLGLSNFLFGLERSQFVFYERGAQRVRAKLACLPTYAHNEGLHSLVFDLFKPFVRTVPRMGPGSRVCVSRRTYSERSRSVQRVFVQQQEFEDAAVRHGFQVVAPETLSLREQIDLFAGAAAIAGESGSGLHNALFAPPGALIGQFCLLNRYQPRIAALRGHRQAYLFPDRNENDASGTMAISVSADKIDAFFRALNDAADARA